MCHSVEGQARRSKNRWPSCVPGQILTSHNLQWAKIYLLPVFQFRSRPGSAGNRGSFVSATVSRNFVYVPSIIVSFPFRLSATSLFPIYQTSRHDYFFSFPFLFFFFCNYTRRREMAVQRRTSVASMSIEDPRLQWFPLIGSISSSNGSVHEIESRICSS